MEPLADYFVDRRNPQSIEHPVQLSEAIRLAEAIEPGNELVTLLDVTPVNRTRSFHNFSLETPALFDDLFLRLTNRSKKSRLGLDPALPCGATQRKAGASPSLLRQRIRRILRNEWATRGNGAGARRRSVKIAIDILGPSSLCFASANKN